MPEQLELDAGIWHDVPAEAYHRDPVPGWSLSASGVKDLLPPDGCPARYRYNRDHGRPDTDAFDFGRAAHRQVLGAGEEIVVVDADSWRTKAAQETRDEARAAGKSPVLARDAEVIEAMATALRAHPVAAALLDPAAGIPETTLVWHDDATGVNCRARLDFMRHHTPGRRLVIPDYKTGQHADPDAWSRSAWNYGYATQADHYLDGIRQLTGAPDPAFVFIVQERRPPFIVSCFELDHTAMQIGAARNRWARNLFRHCLATDTWPGYVPDHEPYLLPLPRWVEITEGNPA